MSGEGVVGFAVYEETDLCYLGEGGVEGSDDGFDGEVFDEDAAQLSWDRTRAFFRTHLATTVAPV